MAVHRTRFQGRPAFRWEGLSKAYPYNEGDEASESYARKRAFLDGVAAGDTQSMSDDEVRAAARVSGALGFRKASQTDPDPDSMMICWYPPASIAAGLTIPGGEATEDLHMTIVHLPKDIAADPNVVEAVTLLESAHHMQLNGCISGTGRFVIDETTDCFYVSIDVPGLEDMRDCIIDSLNRAGVWWQQTHGFTPHITLKYLDRAEPNPGRLDGKVEIEIDSLSMATAAGERTDYPLTPLPEEDAVADVVKRVKAAIGDKFATEDDRSLGEPAPDLEYSIVHRGAPVDPTAEPADPASDAAGTEKEWQYTLGMLYAPSQKDAHDEYAEDEELHRAVVQYSLASAKDPSMRRMKMQHDQTQESGTWVELMRLPAEMTTDVTKADGTTTTMTFPKGAVMMGVIWDDDAWAAVKDGSLGGLSLGGRAVRVDNGDKAEPVKESMGYSKAPKQPAVADKVKKDDSPAPAPAEEEHQPAQGPHVVTLEHAKIMVLDSLASVHAQHAKEMFEVAKRQPNVHLHSPDVVVNPTPPEIVVQSTPPDVHVHQDAAPVAKFVPTRTTVVARDADGLVKETVVTAIDEE